MFYVHLINTCFLLLDYHKVASSKTFYLEAHAGFFRLHMKVEGDFRSLCTVSFRQIVDFLISNARYNSRLRKSSRIIQPAIQQICCLLSLNYNETIYELGKQIYCVPWCLIPSGNVHFALCWPTEY